MKNSKVSIITPCYNSEKYVKKLMDSILFQTYNNIEFIIVNDGSTDRTQQILEEYKEKFKKRRFEYIILNQENQGQAAALNNALKYVSGKYLTWPDSDDYYEKKAIEDMVEFLEENSKYDLVRGNVAYREENDFKLIEIKKSLQPNNTNIFDNYIKEIDTYCYPGYMMIRFDKFVEKNHGRDIYCSRAGQNWQMILPVAYKGRAGYIDEVVYNYIVRKDSHSRIKKNSKEIYKKYKEHEKILKTVIKKVVINSKEQRKYYNLIRNKYLKKKIKLKLKQILSFKN